MTLLLPHKSTFTQNIFCRNCLHSLRITYKCKLTSLKIKTALLQRRCCSKKKIFENEKNGAACVLSFVSSSARRWPLNQIQQQINYSLPADSGYSASSAKIIRRQNALEFYTWYPTRCDLPRDFMRPEAKLYSVANQNKCAMTSTDMISYINHKQYFISSPSQYNI